jgi:hypothetical protein
VDFDGDPANIEKNALATFKDADEGPVRGFAWGEYYYRYDAGASSWNLPFVGKGYGDADGYVTDMKDDGKKEPAFDRSDFKPVERKLPATKAAVIAYDVGATVADLSDMAESVGKFAKSMKENTIDLDGDDGGPISVPGIAKGVIGLIGDIQGIVGIARASVNVKTAGDVKTYSYTTRDRQGRVVDQGRIYERQVGGEFKGYSRTRTTTVKQSQMTGISSKSQTLTDKFKFVSSTQTQ